MDRRQFMGAVAAGAALTAVAKTSVAGETGAGNLATVFEGSFYLTKENPGRWAAKAAGHLPVVEVSKGAGTSKVKVTTPHEMHGYEHYIVKHQLFDEQLNLLGETMFDPAKDGPISSYDIKGYTGVVYAVSVCNKHDAWVSATTV